MGISNFTFPNAKNISLLQNWGKDYVLLFLGWLRKHPLLSSMMASLLFAGSVVLVFQQLVIWGMYGTLPNQAALLHIRLPIASQVISVDGKVLGSYYLEERDPVGFEELSRPLVQTLLATEDIRFYEHDGMDLQSLLRVVFKTLLLGDASSGGGSTLTQQLAKNLYPRQGYGAMSLVVNKFKEIETAQRLERLYPKDELLTMYLNTVSFGENAFGISVASQRFFGKKPAELKQEEMAVLIGMLKAPTSYNPRIHLESSRNRRNVVLQQMARYGYLLQTEADSLSELPLNLDYDRFTHHEGPAPYFREALRQYMLKWCRQHPRRDGSYYNLYTDGLKVYTTIHSDLQTMAEESMREQMERIQKNFREDWKYARKGPLPEEMLRQGMLHSPRYQSWKRAGFTEAEIDSLFEIPLPMRLFSWETDSLQLLSPKDSIIQHAAQLHSGLLALDPQSGHVRAWVGGIHHRAFQFDHVTAYRQSGSTFKPLVYATALEAGYSPCEYIANDKVVYEKYNDWSPQNANRAYGGEYSLQGALTHSVNVAAVNLVMELKPQRVVEMSHRLGIERELPAVPSIALGTAEVSLLELVPVYSCFVNGGSKVNPEYLLRVEDREGQLLDETSQSIQRDSVISRETAGLMTHMLQNVVKEGTARGLRTRFGLTGDIAGKTGTTQSQADGWFVGAMPGLAAGVWVGADDQRVHFRSLRLGQGSMTALPIWGSFMKKVLAHPEFAYLNEMKFPKPSQAMLDSLNCANYDFPLGLNEFRTWWLEQHPEDSVLYQGTVVPVQ